MWGTLYPHRARNMHCAQHSRHCVGSTHLYSALLVKAARSEGAPADVKDTMCTHIQHSTCVNVLLLSDHDVGSTHLYSARLVKVVRSEGLMWGMPSR